MPSPSYTSSSRRLVTRLLCSGALWTAVAFVAIECALDRPMSNRFFSHRVDQLVFDIEHRSYNPRVLILGDSVGLQVGYVASRRDTNIVCMATNGGMEMAGHFFLLRRYLRRNPPPEFVVLLMRDPLSGNLRSIYTENYLQRCFGRPGEIASMAWRRRSVPFALTSIAYRSPTFRYRLQLQGSLSPIQAKITLSGFRPDQTARRQANLAERSLLTRMVDAVFPWPDDTLATTYMRDTLELAKSKGVRCVYIPTPLSDEKYDEKTTSAKYERLTEGLQAFKKSYPANFDYTLDILRLPADEFSDTTHLRGGSVPKCADDFLAKLKRFTNP